MSEQLHPGMFPAVRMRRLRYHPGVRRLVAEPGFAPRQLLLPLFVRPGEGLRREVGSMPGVFQLSPDLAAEEVRQAGQLGLGGVLLFGIPEHKDATGSDALSEEGIVACVSANIPITAIAARWAKPAAGARWTTTPRWLCWASRR